MAEDKTIQTNAQILASRWGWDKAKSGVEVADFKKVFGDLRLTDAQSCVLGAWMGGAPEDAEQGWFDNRESAEDACKRSVSDVPTVRAALDALQAASPATYELVAVKGGAKQRAAKISLDANAKQDAVQLAKDVVVGTQNLAKEVVGGAADVIGSVLTWRVAIGVLLLIGVLVIGLIIYTRVVL